MERSKIIRSVSVSEKNTTENRFEQIRDSKRNPRELYNLR